MQFINAATIAERLDVPSLVDALRDGFRRGCEMPVRHRHTLARSSEPDASLVLMPAWQPDGVLGVKLTTIVPGNAQRDLPSVMPIYVLFDPVTGEPKSVLDGRSITLHRTAATSALASTYLSREDSRRLLMVGTGSLAPYLIRAHCAVRPIEEVVVWGRRAERAQQVVDGLSGLGARPSVAHDLREAASRADIISCATLAQAPLVAGEWLAPGTHLDLVGSFTPAMREVDDEAIRRARLYVDKRDACLSESGDLIQPIQAGVISPDDVIGDLFDLVRGDCRGREAPQDITLFKSVGIALEDLVAASLVTQRL